MLLTVPELIAQARQGLRSITAAVAIPECVEKSGVIIDVREPAEVQAKPAPTSVNIPRGVVEMMVLEKFKNSAHPIYLHCASGARACLAAEQLQRLGYDNVTVISCTIDDICKAQV